MGYHYTRSCARNELEESNVEPNDAAPSTAATSPLPPSIIVGQSDAAAGRPESVSTESAGPVSAPTHSLPAGSPPPRADAVCQGLWVLLKWGSPPWGTPAV